MWTLAESALFARYGKAFGLDEKRALLGNSGPAAERILERLLERPGRGPQLWAELLRDVVDLMREDGAPPRVGAVELVGELRAARRPIAVASSSPRAVVGPALAAAGLEGAFDAVVTGDLLQRLKPDPDAYLEACRLLRSDPTDTVALEDSPTGVASARAAGLYVVGVPSVPGVVLDADLVAPSLADPSVRTALGLPARRHG